MNGSRTLFLSLLVGLTGGCFDEIIQHPGATDGSTEGSGSGSNSDSQATTVGSDGSTSVADTTGAMTDDDADTTGSTSAGTETAGTTGEPAEHLCEGVRHLCQGESWVVEPCADCAELTPLAQCAFETLGGSFAGEITVERCDGDCVRDHYIFRPGGVEVLVESMLLDGDKNEVELVGRQMCGLVDMMYFLECVQSYVESCAEPTTWVSGCEPFTGDTCPFTIGL